MHVVLPLACPTQTCQGFCEPIFTLKINLCLKSSEIDITNSNTSLLKTKQKNQKPKYVGILKF